MRIARPSRTTASTSRPAAFFPNAALYPRSLTTWTSGLSSRQSRALTKWIVDLISATRTTARSAMRLESDPGSKLSRRLHSPT